TRPVHPVCSTRCTLPSRMPESSGRAPSTRNRREAEAETAARGSAHQEQLLLLLSEEVVPRVIEPGRVLLHHEDLLSARLADDAPGVELDGEVRAGAERARGVLPGGGPHVDARPESMTLESERVRVDLRVDPPGLHLGHGALVDVGGEAPGPGLVLHHHVLEG